MKEPSRTPSDRLHLFANLTPTEQDALRGKILVVGGNPERVLATEESLEVAKQYIRDNVSGLQSYRLVQGPPLEDFTLVELEDH